MLFKGVSSLNLSCFIFTAACPAFLKYALPTQAFSGELCKVFKNTYFVEQQLLPKKLFLTYVLSIKGSFIYQ